MSIVALLTALTLTAAACGGGGGEETGELGDPERGGTFRVEIDEFPWEQGYGFDPTVEYVGDDWTLLKTLLIRGLTGYRYVTAEEGGTEAIPDMAEGLGEFSEDGLTVTYKIKPGIRFGDPVGREITAQDFVTSFERLGTAELTAGGYANYFVPLVEGMQAFNDGEADSISGVTAVDDRTVQFKLTKPSPDWDFRMAMPAAAPIPEEAATCFTGYATYGNYLVSSGPYQFEGMDQVDFSDCDDLTPPSGFKLEEHMLLERNPNYDASTDNPEARESFPDRFEFRKNTNPENSYDKLARGEIDYAWATPPPDVIARYSRNEDLKKFMFQFPDNSTWYLTMTMTQPPFDDVNVRKAVNAIMDKTGMIQAWGGVATGIPAEHAVPPTVLNALNAGEYDPYKSENHRGDLEAAQAFMKESKYDTDGDGLCDADACKNLTHITRETDPFPNVAAVVDSSLEKIGITTRLVEAASFYGAAGTPAKPVHITSGSGWGPDWAEPITFFELTFLGTSISIANNINISMTGFTAQVAQNLNSQYEQQEDQELKGLKVDPPAAPVPGIDDRFAACADLEPGDERAQCWIDLDMFIMEEIVPWVPYRWGNDVDIVGPAVTKYEFDTFGANIAFSHVAVDPSKQT